MASNLSYAEAHNLPTEQTPQPEVDYNKLYDEIPTFAELKDKYGNDPNFTENVRNSRWGKEGENAKAYLAEVDAANANVETTDKAEENNNNASAETTDNAKAKNIQERTEELKESPKFRYKVNSIWDAYKSGDIDEQTRDYMVMNAVATGLGNIGRSVGNVGAQFSGGTIDTSKDTSAWEQRNAEMIKQGISGEAASITGSDAEVKRLSDVYNLDKEQFESYVRNNRKDLASSLDNDKLPPELKYTAKLYQNKLLTGNVTKEDYLAATAIGMLKEHPELADKVIGLFDTATGTLTATADAILGLANSVSGLLNGGKDTGDGRGLDRHSTIEHIIKPWTVVQDLWQEGVDNNSRMKINRLTKGLGNLNTDFKEFENDQTFADGLKALESGDGEWLNKNPNFPNKFRNYQKKLDKALKKRDELQAMLNDNEWLKANQDIAGNIKSAVDYFNGLESSIAAMDEKLQQYRSKKK